MEHHDGFDVDDRRGQNHDADAGPDIVERDADGAECLYRIIDGRKVMVKRGGHAIEQLDRHHVRVDPPRRGPTGAAAGRGAQPSGGRGSLERGTERRAT